MEYPQTHTEISPKPRKKLFSLPPPSPSGGGVVATPLPLISGMIPLDENFYHSFLVLTLIGG